MFVRKRAIDAKTQDFICKEVDRYLVHTEGSDIDSVISEVVNDKDIFAFLAMHLKQGLGLMVGYIDYWDDTRVFVHYGLTLNFDRIPRRTSIYTYESFSSMPLSDRHSRLTLDSRICGKDGERPDPEGFISQVNAVLQNPKPYLIELSFEK